MPNSVIQGLTTTTDAALNRLTPFTTTALLGLFALVDPDHPEREVQARPSDVLEVMEISRNVAHAVRRTWQTADGQDHSECYSARRHSPRALQDLHGALCTLHDQKVEIHRKGAHGRTVRCVHLLDAFGYIHQENGQPLDVYNLPPGITRVNVATERRPLYRLRRAAEGGDQALRPAGIVFRVNTELAAEMRGEKDTVRFTFLARTIFALLRRFSRDPVAIRLIVLIVRQTIDVFKRKLRNLLDDLGCEARHPGRGQQRLEQLLGSLQGLGLVSEYAVDAPADAVRISRAPNWYQRADPAPGPPAVFGTRTPAFWHANSRFLARELPQGRAEKP